MEPLMSLTFSQLLVPVLLAVIIGLIVGFSFSRSGNTQPPVVLQTDVNRTGELVSLLVIGVVAGGVVIALLMRILS
jgi:hypothetical protein